MTGAEEGTLTQCMSREHQQCSSQIHPADLGRAAPINGFPFHSTNLSEWRTASLLFSMSGKCINQGFAGLL
jgi:hypothetical protein